MTVTDPEVTEPAPSKQKRKPMETCGHCQNGFCENCPRMVVWFGSRWQCRCKREGCRSQIVRCLQCKIEGDDVSPSEWRCYDRDACAARVEARLDANPYVQQVRASRERARVSENAEKAAKTERVKAEKPETFCLVTGEKTKGGKFKPGMDAKYVSLRVEEVMGDKATEAATLKRFDDEVGSDALKAKFVKSLGLARERAAKKVAAAEAKAKGDEKAAEAEKPAKKAAAKKS